MFDWFWNFLYLISKSMFNLIDSLMKCANILCGIDPIVVEGRETSFITYLLTDERVTLGFRVTVLMGILLVGIFAIFGIIRSIVNDKNNTTPAQVVGKTVKTVMIFFFVPLCMTVFTYVTNVFVQALYSATLGGSTAGIGNFLCGAFGENGRKVAETTFYLNADFDYMSTGKVREYIDLTEFDYFFSWISSICILIALAKALLMFVDRAISIVLLYLFAPISMSASVIDDGAHFKLWRDQILVKYLTGYGSIIGINVYMLIISLISADSVVFFPNSSVLNNIAKIAFILGGSVSLQRVMALVGNLVSAGAGSNELRDNAIAAAGFRGAVGAVGSALTSPLRAGRSLTNFVRDTANRGFGYAVGSRLGLRTDRDYGIRSESEQKREAESKRREHEQLGAIIGSKISDALAGHAGSSGGGNAPSSDLPKMTSNNANPSAPAGKKNSPMIDNAITNSINGAGMGANSSNKK